MIESVKAVSDLFAPVSGTVAEVNADLADHPENVNTDCYGDGWMLAVVYDDAEEVEALLDAGRYRKHCEDRAED